MPSKENVPTSPKLRRREPKTFIEEESSNQNLDDSKEQVEAIERIKSCKDYYEILGVAKDAGESDLRKQYRKLALQFHPDKNKTPGAVEAFKAIGNAFAVLNDPEKRKQYDMYGLEGAQRMHSCSGHNGRPDYSHGFEGDITPEDLFNMFFGGGNTYVRRGNQWHRYSSRPTTVRQEDSRSVIFQMLPLLVLVSLSLISSIFVTDPPYSLSRTSKYLYEQRTRNLEVPYFVKEDFANEYKGKIPNIEKQVEEDYLINVRSSCFRERNYKENMIWRAKSFKNAKLEENARNLRTPSCDALNDLFANMNV